MTEPLGMTDFHNLMARSYMTLTDSGGIQEEGIALGIPVLVLRNRSERTEGISHGGMKLVGTEEEGIYKSFCELLGDAEEYKKWLRAIVPSISQSSSCGSTNTVLCLKYMRKVP